MEEKELVKRASPLDQAIKNALPSSLTSEASKELRSILKKAIKDALKGAVAGSIIGYGAGAQAGVERGEGNVIGGTRGAKKGALYGALGAGILSASGRAGLSKVLREKFGPGMIPTSALGALIGADVLANLSGASSGGAQEVIIKNSSWRRFVGDVGLGAGLGAIAGGAHGAYQGYNDGYGFRAGLQQGMKEGLRTGALYGVAGGALRAKMPGATTDMLAPAIAGMGAVHSWQRGGPAGLNPPDQGLYPYVPDQPQNEMMYSPEMLEQPMPKYAGWRSTLKNELDNLL